MNCILKVKGTPGGTHGKPRHDREGPVRDFVIDNQVFYRLVYNHVRQCELCDPTEVLRAYLARRMCKKHQDMTSDGLVKLALRYERLDRGVPRELVDEFIWRGGPYAMAEQFGRLSLEDVARGARVALASKARDHDVLSWFMHATRDRPEARIMTDVAELVHSGASPDEIRQLLPIFEVQQT